MNYMASYLQLHSGYIQYGRFKPACFCLDFKENIFIMKYLILDP